MVQLHLNIGNQHTCMQSIAHAAHALCSQTHQRICPAHKSCSRLRHIYRVLSTTPWRSSKNWILRWSALRLQTQTAPFAQAGRHERQHATHRIVTERRCVAYQTTLTAHVVSSTISNACCGWVAAVQHVWIAFTVVVHACAVANATRMLSGDYCHRRTHNSRHKKHVLPTLCARIAVMVIGIT